MEGGAGAYNPRTAEEVFRDFRGRRAGMIKALTTEVEKFYQLCDPEKENLCLYGLPSETWEVNLPAEEVPPELPEPALGINFARDGMDEKDWLSLVAVHSDAWLLAVAFYFGARFGFDKDASYGVQAHLLGQWMTIPKQHRVFTRQIHYPWEPISYVVGERDFRRYLARRRLFQMINGLPTIFEVVTGTAKKQIKEKTPNSSAKSNKSNSKPSSRQSEIKTSKMAPPKEEDDSEGGEEEEEDEDEHGNTLCGACGDNYANDEFWICCDICERWFHGKCVRITPARAEHIKQYKCPACSNKRARA